MLLSFSADVELVPSFESLKSYDGKLRASSISVNGEALEPTGKRADRCELNLTKPQRAAWEGLFGSPEGIAALASGTVSLPDAHTGRKLAAPVYSLAERLAAAQAAAQVAQAEEPTAEPTPRKRTAR